MGHGKGKEPLKKKNGPRHKARITQARLRGERKGAVQRAPSSCHRSLQNGQIDVLDLCKVSDLALRTLVKRSLLSLLEMYLVLSWPSTAPQ